MNTLSGADLKVTLDHGCTGSDDYGSNDCTLQFGDSKPFTVTYDLKLDQDIVEGTKISANLKLDNLIPFTLECDACGSDCTFEIPIVKKSVTIPVRSIVMIAKRIELSTERDTKLLFFCLLLLKSVVSQSVFLDCLFYIT